MSKKATITLLLLLVGFLSYSQINNSNQKKQYFEAEELLDFNKYNEAAKIFSELNKEIPDNNNLNFKLGYCLLNSSYDKKDAIKHLQTAVMSVSLEYNYDDYKETNTPIETYFYLGNALQFDYQFEEAIFNYTKFKEYLTQDDIVLNKKIEKRIEECNTGILLIQYPVKMNILNLGSNVNSEFDDHSPVFTADESILVYTSKRKSSSNNVINDDDQYWENIYICNKDNSGNWSTPKSISSNINENKNIASISLSVDGQEAFLYRDDKGDGNIYLTKLEGDEWTIPEKLPETINSKSKESHASISADGSTLYFTSNKKGGFGGNDIYKVKRLPNGQWGQSMNLGPTINTEYDEESPFIHPDGVTLFFSSKGHKNIGGFDIFFTMNEGEGWMEPSNIGYPISTTGDDVFYSPTPDGRRAYYSSKQKGGYGGSDLYLISLPNNAEKALTVYSGQVLLSDGKPPENVIITVTDASSLEDIGVYTPNSKTGKFLFILQPGNSYNILVEADNHLFYNETIDVKDNESYQKLEKAIILDPVIFGGISGSFDITFEKDKSVLNNVAENEFNNIASFLQKNPKVIVGVKPLTNEEQGIYKARLDAITNSLKEKGIKTDRVMPVKKVGAGEKSINIIIKEIDENKNVIVDNSVKPNENNNTVIKVNGNYIINYILFDFDKSETDNYQNSFDNLSKYLNNNKSAKIAIYAYADALGSYEYNLDLTQKRAEFVKTKLVTMGVSGNQIQIVAKSNTDFISKNTTAESRKYNRRVEFKIIKPGKSEVEIKKVDIPEKFKL